MANTEKKAEPKVKKVSIMVPYVEGEPDEVNVTVNGETIQVLRGETVEIPEAYAEVLKSQAKMAKYAKRQDEKLKEQVTVMD
ncbi:MAG: hypothetical protein Q4B18_02650 [Bacillota bacterium]|nr:hypothetical protein [Bacillota bacterium]